MLTDLKKKISPLKTVGMKIGLTAVDLDRGLLPT